MSHTKTKNMIVVESPPYLPEAHRYPEAVAATSPDVARTLGHAAAGDQVISRGLEELEAYANGQVVQGDTRIQDIDAAHEAALLENEIFDAHVAAIKENEIFDAHVAALEEDKKRAEAKAHQQAPEQPPRPKELASTTRKTNPERASEAVTPAPAEELRKEAAAALAEAGVVAQLPATSRVSKELDGKLLIVDGNNAKVITRMSDGKPKVTEYAYDKEEGTLTVNTSGTNSITGRVIEYEPTAVKNWQTHDTIITLPPALSKRFGIERAVVVKPKD